MCERGTLSSNILPNHLRSVRGHRWSRCYQRPPKEMVWGCVCVRKCFKSFLDLKEKKIQLCQYKKILTETSHFVLKFSFAARGCKRRSQAFPTFLFSTAQREALVANQPLLFVGFKLFAQFDASHVFKSFSATYKVQVVSVHLHQLKVTSVLKRSPKKWEKVPVLPVD